MATKKEGPTEPIIPVKDKVKALGHRQVLESPLSVVKMDVSELRNYTNRIGDFLASPGAAAIKICECCINVD